MPPVRPIAVSTAGLLLSFCEWVIPPCAESSVAVQLPEVGVPLELTVFACVEGDRYEFLGLWLEDMGRDYDDPPGFTLEVVGDGVLDDDDPLYADASASPATCDKGIAVTITRIDADAPPGAVLHLTADAGEDPNRCEIRVEARP